MGRRRSKRHEFTLIHVIRKLPRGQELEEVENEIRALGMESYFELRFSLWKYVVCLEFLGLAAVPHLSWRLVPPDS